VDRNIDSVRNLAAGNSRPLREGVDRNCRHLTSRTSMESRPLREGVDRNALSRRGRRRHPVALFARAWIETAKSATLL